MRVQVRTIDASLRGEALARPTLIVGHAQRFGTLMMSAAKSMMKAGSFHLFEFAQRFKVFVVPVHYYVPLSSTRELRRTRSFWNKPTDMAPLRLSMDSQRRILDEWIRPFEPEYRGNTTYRDGVNNYAGPGFGFIEAQALHAFIRKTRPRRVIEVGSGVSTWCMLAALKMNAAEDGAPFALSCIDPNPSAFLRSLPVHLQKSKVEDVDLSFFDQLEKGDFLQIDSSHAVRCCGDVAKIYTEIVPRLRPGVFVHIHDVTFPYMFPRDVEETYTQAMETVVLFTLLADSPRYETLLCLSYLHHKDPAALKAAFPEYDPQPNIGGLPGSDVKRFGEKRHFPSSIYIVVKKPALN